MFQKVRIRLTLLCAGITIFILLIMSWGWLSISEKSLRTNSFISFQNDMSTLLGNLEQQPVITHEWLKKMEGNGKYRLWLLDNGVPFLHNRQHKEYEDLFKQAVSLFEAQTESIAFFSQEFSGYYACSAALSRNQGTLFVVVLSPLTSLSRQLHLQRLTFLALDLGGAAALIFFSWYYTKRLLLPLEQNQKNQARFVAAASHELRTPLSVILSCTAAARKADARGQERFLCAAEAEGKRMSRLIDDMLLLSRADTHSWSIRLSPADADTLILDAYEAFLPAAAKRNLRLLVSLPDYALPSLICDRERIYQVLSILLDNALCYTPAGGSVCLSLSCSQNVLSMSVADNGPGISDEDKPHIFERFYRADSSRTRREHFGLGLCIAYEIIKNHRGTLTLSDTPGGGSTFTISFRISY